MAVLQSFLIFLTNITKLYAVLDVGKWQSVVVWNCLNKLTVFELVPCICHEVYPIHQTCSYTVGAVRTVVFRQDYPVAECSFDNAMRTYCCSDSIFSVKSDQGIASIADYPRIITKAYESCIAARERRLCTIVQAYDLGVYTCTCDAAVFTCIQNLILVAGRNDTSLLFSVHNLCASSIGYYGWSHYYMP